MDWTLAIERNRKALGCILAGLVAIVGRELRRVRLEAADTGAYGEGGGSRPGAEARDAAAACPDAGACGAGVPGRALPRHVHGAVLRLLRPAESAVRRLVVVASRGIVVPPPRRTRPRRSGTPAVLRQGAAGTGLVLPRGVHLPGAAPRMAGGPVRLPLFDRPRRLLRPRRPSPAALPRISVPGVGWPSPPRAGGALRGTRRPERVDATRLVLRLDALGAALDDLEGQALRFARWRARREAAQQRARQEDAALCGFGAAFGQGAARAAAGAPPPAHPAFRARRVWPLRAGRPPGSRRRGREEIHEILADLHGLALDVLERRDTS